MSVEIVTKDDLIQFRIQLLHDLRDVLANPNTGKSDSIIEGYKTKHVRKILDCSVNKLVSLRINRNLRTKKIGGTLYYNREDVKRILEEGY